MSLRSKGRERTKAGPGFHEAIGFDADAQAYFLEVGLTDPAYTAPISQFVVDLKAASLWNKFDRLWILANANATAALTCIKSLATMTPVNAPTFTAGMGYAGNGTTSYLNTGFIPSTHGVNYTLNSACVGFFSRTVGLGGRDTGAGVVTALPTLPMAQVIADFGDGNAYGAVNSEAGTFISGLNGGASGLWMASRTNAAAVALYKNGSALLTGATASNGIPTNAIFLGTNNGNGGSTMPGGFTTRQYTMEFIGAGFSTLEAAAFDTTVAALKMAIGF